MSTPNTPDPMVEQVWSPTTLLQWYKQLPRWLKRSLWLLLFYLFGPMISYAKGLQLDAAGPSWQAEKRWAQVKGGVLPWLLVYIPVIFFHTALASFWASIFTTLADWLHLPFLVWLGGTTLFPPVPSSTLLRWVLAYPLAGLLALSMEVVDPRTTWQSKRVITPEEQQELDVIAAAEEKKRLAQAKRKLKATQATTSTSADTNVALGTSTTPNPTTLKKPKKPRTPARSKQAPQPVIPPANSLWGQIDWNAVPNDHPLKQVVREEAERLEAQRREEERNRWLAQQYAAQTTSPQSEKISIIDSTFALPAPSSPPTSPLAPADLSASTHTTGKADEQEYDWDEGDGSIQE